MEGKSMFGPENREELTTKGYTVVRDVLSNEECDNCMQQYQTWLQEFSHDVFPPSMHSLISQFNTGHMEPTWFVRLKAKSVFAKLWQTSKLLTSIDAIAIGRPPEDGKENFAEPSKSWLHVDQNASRVGLHAVQGGVYLEEACEDDWTLEVLEGSHWYFEEFFEGRQDAARISELNIFYKLTEDDIKFYEGKGCQKIRVSVPKGGIVLWDSRLVHANARPRKDREHPGRWRYVVFVSMTPAHWASETDMAKKRYAYNNVVMTTHWSSQGVKTHGSGLSISGLPTKIPEIATTNKAKELAGMVRYDFEDGKSNGPKKPTWKVSKNAITFTRANVYTVCFVLCQVFIVIVAYLFNLF